jgi:hypothetical protein
MSCPNCGYCPHCGRSDQPWYPNPYYPGPSYPSYPWGQTPGGVAPLTIGTIGTGLTFDQIEQTGLPAFDAIVNLTADQLSVIFPDD